MTSAPLEPQQHVPGEEPVAAADPGPGAPPRADRIGLTSASLDRADLSPARNAGASGTSEELHPVEETPLRAPEVPPESD